MYIKYINETLTWKFERILLSLSSFLFDVPRAVYRLLSLNTN